MDLVLPTDASTQAPGPRESGQLHITESPRDAQQGLPFTISVEKRAAYINELMKAGYDVIDFGSFVSPKAVPQMAQSEEVLDLIDTTVSGTQLLAIVGNLRGAEQAAAQDKLHWIGFPYSISTTFLEKNINTTIEKIDATTAGIGKIAADHHKHLRVFISMAFGNPYGDRWDASVLRDAVAKLVDSGVRTITLADTIGLATADSIRGSFEYLLPLYPDIELGLHLHTEKTNWREKINAAWQSGCRNYDGVLNGIGGCPMTGYELMGNLNTLDLLAYFKAEAIAHPLDELLIQKIAMQYSSFS